jgi:hypothetical protein
MAYLTGDDQAEYRETGGPLFHCNAGLQLCWFIPGYGFRKGVGLLEFFIILVYTRVTPERGTGILWYLFVTSLYSIVGLLQYHSILLETLITLASSLLYIFYIGKVFFHVAFESCQ